MQAITYLIQFTISLSLIKNGGIRIQEECRGNKPLFEIGKKGKLKTKNLSKIAILNEQEPSVQLVDITKAMQV